MTQLRPLGRYGRLQNAANFGVQSLSGLCCVVELPESCAALQAFLMETSSLQCRNAGRLLLGRNRLENNLGDGFGL
jgi:hypothetical protein